MVGPADAENRKAIEAFGRIAVVGELPMFDRLDAAAVSDWATRCLDPTGQLLECLR